MDEIVRLSRYLGILFLAINALFASIAGFILFLLGSFSTGAGLYLLFLSLGIWYIATSLIWEKWEVYPGALLMGLIYLHFLVFFFSKLQSIPDLLNIIFLIKVLILLGSASFFCLLPSLPFFWKKMKKAIGSPKPKIDSMRLLMGSLSPLMVLIIMPILFLFLSLIWMCDKIKAYPETPSCRPRLKCDRTIL